MEEGDSRDLSNPKAPSGYAAPKFALPTSKNTASIRNLTMTPRAVVASVRAFSRVVMTPRAGEAGSSSSGGGQSKVSLPNPPASALAGAGRRVVRGPKESAKEKTILAEGYVDRAIGRREQTRRDTELNPDGERTAWTPPQEGPGGHQAPVSEPAQNLDLAEVRRLKNQLLSEKDLKGPDRDISGPFTRPITYRSQMAESICTMLGLDPLRAQPAQEISQPLRRTVYFYELHISTTPRTSTKSILEDLLGASGGSILLRSDGRLEAEVVGILQGGACRPPTKAPVPAPVPAPDDDIFPGAGEYVCEPKGPSAAKTSTGPGLFDPIRSTGPGGGEAVPKSIETLVDRLRGSIKESADIEGEGEVDWDEPLAREENLPGGDDYEECYPGVFQSVGVEYDSDGEDGAPSVRKPLTKRQAAAKERHKLEAQMRKVTKIMQEKKKDFQP